MEKYKNKYRIPSTRASCWNYGWAGAYFITICTKNRKHFYGKIQNGKMELSRVGVIADILWHEIPQHAKNVELGAFVVMPNHIHGILILTENNTNPIAKSVETLHATTPVETLHATMPVETLHATSLRMASISPKPNSVSTIIRSYKSAVTKNANRLGYEFGWQSLFHDHIIRNDEEYQRINDYIENNPINWGKDKFFIQETK